MFLADEWSHFGSKRKALRVSTPKGDQRKTYFLQLPYRIAIPLVSLSAFLHWLVSQSIFLASVAEYDEVGKLISSVAVATCGYSLLAMIFVMVLGGLIMVSTVGVGCRRFNSAIPLVGSCSSAISAACHQLPEEEDAALKPLKWGEVPGRFSNDGPPHCAFSSKDVKPPTPGTAYA